MARMTDQLKTVIIHKIEFIFLKVKENKEKIHDYIK